MFMFLFDCLCIIFKYMCVYIVYTYSRTFIKLLKRYKSQLHTLDGFFYFYKLFDEITLSEMSRLLYDDVDTFTIKQLSDHLYERLRTYYK